MDFKPKRRAKMTKEDIKATLALIAGIVFVLVVVYVLGY